MTKFKDRTPVTSTGTGASAVTFNIGFQPNSLTFRIFSKSGSTTSTQLCIGGVDDTGYQIYDSQAKDNALTAPKNVGGTNKVWSVYENVSGVWTEVMSANFHSFVANGFKLNIPTTSSNYEVQIIASN